MNAMIFIGITCLSFIGMAILIIRQSRQIDRLKNDLAKAKAGLAYFLKVEDGAMACADD